MRFSAFIKKVAKADKQPQVLLELTGDDAVMFASALMGMTPGLVTVDIENAQQELPLDNEPVAPQQSAIQQGIAGRIKESRERFAANDVSAIFDPEIDEMVD